MKDDQKLNTLILLFCLVSAAVFLVSGRWRQVETDEPEHREESWLCRSSELYTYDEMMHDIDLMRFQFAGQFRVDSLALTADGREVFDIVIGNSAANHRIMVNGAIHAREYVTSRLVMCQLLDILEKEEDGTQYKGNEIREVLEDTEIHFLPMLNPDGVEISQSGLDGLRTPAMKVRARSIAAQDGQPADELYFSQWWSNANGVDLNRNFDALWKKYDDGVHHPSYKKYKGTSVECEAESAAVAKLVREKKFSAILCYHAPGEVIYWYFRQNGELRRMTEAYAEELSQITGYRTDVNFQSVDPAGLKDWALEKEGIPGFTIEIGGEDNQVDAEEFRKLWEENRYVILETAVAAAEGRLFRIPPRILEAGEHLTVVKCSEYTYLRARPNSRAEELARIPLGAEVTFEGYANDEFYRVTYQGQTGYAMINFLE